MSGIHNDGGAAPYDGGFHTTHWSVVMSARQQDGIAAQEALASLCASYWYPLYSFVRGRGASPHDAEDLTQEFFRRFLEKNSLLNVSPAKGKFRSFLLASLKHFLTNEWEHAHAQKRGGGQTLISLDAQEGETRLSLEPADHSTPEELFEKRWAFAVLQRTMQALEAEHAVKARTGFFRELKAFLPGGQANTTRAQFAVRHGMSAGAVDVAVHRLRQRFGVLLREQVAQTVSSEAEVDEEIRYLMAVLSR